MKLAMINVLKDTKGAEEGHRIRFFKAGTEGVTTDLELAQELESTGFVEITAIADANGNFQDVDGRPLLEKNDLEVDPNFFDEKTLSDMTKANLGTLATEKGIVYSSSKLPQNTTLVHDILGVSKHADANIAQMSDDGLAKLAADLNVELTEGLSRQDRVALVSEALSKHNEDSARAARNAAQDGTAV